ncbi:BgTH12-02528 [Blumeria graminis f. sp. triticale]|uniref:BgtA-20954 n=3 Tax=Blumeria graminis TaxID=34373 RepID=A0A381LE72_BLUGR|nr:BgTH12-02528 [Blumeria graminis f. sp. triticale]VDB86356.1 BgtA-20954 [Blumeria graminis f. sp. tritici]
MLYTPFSDCKTSAKQSSVARATASVVKRAQLRRGNSSECKYISINESWEDTSVAGTSTSADMSTSASCIKQSTNSGAINLSGRTLSPREAHEGSIARSFVTKYGRRYLRDSTMPYPLPSDLTEIHRQMLRTMLLCQVFDGPLCSPSFRSEPPASVLEIACGSGFWSEMCHQHFSRKGHTSISFTGIDVVKLGLHGEAPVKNDMNWRFIQHDLRQVPLPFPDEEFNCVMVKDLSMVTPITDMQQLLMDEYLRILKPGGTLEIWDSDHSLRMLLPPEESDTRGEEHKSVETQQTPSHAPGTYIITQQTSLAAPRNKFILEYNAWIAKALEARNLTCLPCTAILPLLLQESEALQDIESQRIAIPLGEIGWEQDDQRPPVARESTASPSKGKARVAESEDLDELQTALRRTALTTVVQMIESLEPILREASGKRPEEWDSWMGNMINYLLQKHDTLQDECLEVGAWWARKKEV